MDLKDVGTNVETDAEIADIVEATASYTLPSAEVSERRRERFWFEHPRLAALVKR